MGVLATLETTSITVEPGGEASCEVTVRNSGSVVDEFAIDVVGEASAWSTVEPPTISLFPGASGVVLVRFHPPRLSAVTAGAIPFAVRVSSREDPSGSVAEEGEIRVGDFAEVTAELLPRTSKGRRSTRHELAIDNRGNQPLNAEIWAVSPDDLLAFEFAPPDVRIAAGEAAFTRVTVTPLTRFWRGPARTHPFTVSIGTDTDAPTVTVEGTMLQEALLPKWLPKALLALAALLLLLWILWLTVLKPSVESAARDAVAEEVEALEAEVAAAQDAAAAAQDAAQAAEETAEAAQEDAAGGDGSPITDPTVPTAEPADLLELGDSFDLRLQTTAAVGDSGIDRFIVPDGQRFLLSDIVLQNPQGDSGFLQILRADATLIEVSLENFRDLDYHFVAPIIFNAGDSLGLRVQCTETSGERCRAAAYVAGFLNAA